MLYRFTAGTGALGKIEPLPFLDTGGLQQHEKDLENLLASHLLDVLLEDAPFLTLSQDREYADEADLYALTRNGDLVIIQLTRGIAGTDAVSRAMDCAQRAGRWTISELERRYERYLEKKGQRDEDLRRVHRDAFQLVDRLAPSSFNRRQHLYIVGSAANEGLVDAIDYWKNQGLSVEFLPYRIYEIGNEQYFEFISLPYDRHPNPAVPKGVIFGTDSNSDVSPPYKMLAKSRVAACGNNRHVVERLNPGDIVFFYDELEGIVATGVVSGPVCLDGQDEQYRDVRLLTPMPSSGTGTSARMTPKQISKVTGKAFFWGKPIKLPYLDRDDVGRLLTELRIPFPEILRFKH